MQHKNKPTLQIPAGCSLIRKLIQFCRTSIWYRMTYGCFCFFLFFCSNLGRASRRPFKVQRRRVSRSRCEKCCESNVGRRLSTSCSKAYSPASKLPFILNRHWGGFNICWAKSHTPVFLFLLLTPPSPPPSPPLLLYSCLHPPSLQHFLYSY